MLSLVYQAPSEKMADTVRSILGTLKETLIVVEDTQSIDFQSAWQQMKDDAITRLEQSGFVCRFDEAIASPRVLSAREYVNLKRIAQEVVSNIIKHGQKGPVEIAAQIDAAGLIEMSFTNHIGKEDCELHSSKRGLLNIKSRIEEINGWMKKTNSVSPAGQRQFSFELALPLSR